MRGSSDHFDISEELASVDRSPVRGIATVKDISQEVEWTECYILMFSGSYGSTLCGTNRGLIGRTCNAEAASCPKPIFLHCNIRQQTLWKIVGYLLCRGLCYVSRRLYPFPRAASSRKRPKRSTPMFRTALRLEGQIRVIYWCLP